MSGSDNLLLLGAAGLFGYYFLGGGSRKPVSPDIPTPTPIVQSKVTSMPLPTPPKGKSSKPQQPVIQEIVVPEVSKISNSPPVIPAPLVSQLVSTPEPTPQVNSSTEAAK